MSIFDQLCFLSLFWSCQKSALIAILKLLLVASLLILGYDATASSNHCSLYYCPAQLALFFEVIKQRFDAVGWAAGRASGL